MSNSRFKFRVWDKENKRWCCGLHDGRQVLTMFFGGDSLDMTTIDNDKFEIIQSTGLYDCEGRVVWEGDIIEKEYCKEGEHRYQEVVFETDIGSCGCCFPAFEGSGFVLPHGRWKVAGNRFENSGLLEGILNDRRA